MTADEGADQEEFAIMTVSAEDDERYRAIFAVDKVNPEMEIDTGAASVISQTTYWKKFSHLPLQPAAVKLNAYNGGHIRVLGQFKAKVEYEEQAVGLPLLVVKGHGAALCGRNWLRQLRLNWKQIKYVNVTKPKTIKDLLDKYSEVSRTSWAPLRTLKLPSM